MVRIRLRMRPGVLGSHELAVHRTRGCQRRALARPMEQWVVWVRRTVCSIIGVRIACCFTPVEPSARVAVRIAVFEVGCDACATGFIHHHYSARPPSLSNSMVQWMDELAQGCLPVSTHAITLNCLP